VFNKTKFNNQRSNRVRRITKQFIVLAASDRVSVRVFVTLFAQKLKTTDQNLTWLECD